ncbi:nicotinamide mononucleotide (NMN) deamidase PncC [Bacillus sp. 153480037-1]|uniref:Nicotinamide mononucleotide (NMN) deamidase PncC n=1 Tax=Bacillus aerius TaxID=293388 RepID=A0ABR6B0Y5_9BACI|nr:nicotinamide mononucleotide (NMN) deamidase PncC [Bacillus aerius]
MAKRYKLKERDNQVMGIAFTGIRSPEGGR